jgi:hypothetical protein
MDKHLCDIVQWGTNQNVVFKTANFESLPRAQKLVFSHDFFTKALSLSQLYVSQMSRPKDPPKKSYSKSTNIGSIFPHCFLQLHMLVDC